MEILKLFVWPITVAVIVIIVILILKGTIKDLLGKITTIKYGNIGAEVNHQKQSVIEKDKPLGEQKLSSEIINEDIERALGIFSKATLESAKEVVDNDSKISEITDPNKKADILHKYSEALYLILSCERIYHTIYGSQLYLLEYVNTDGTQTKEALRTFYDSAVKSNEDFYANYKYDDYFNYLVTTELIVHNQDGTYSITWLGRDLLKYIVETGKTLNKKY